jgi:hypothetical protein
MNDKIIYCNTEKLTLSSFEAIFFQPTNWNVYIGSNKYIYYGWWSPKNSVTYFTGLLSELFYCNADMGWLDTQISDEIKEHKFDFELKSNNWDDEKLVCLDSKIYFDIEFLIQFIWDDGDPSVGIRSGYIPQLVLNNEKPVYRLYQI